MTDAAPNLLQLFALAREGRIPQRVRTGAMLEIAQLLARAALADRRKVETLERGIAIQQLLDQGRERAEIMLRLGLTVPQYKRALREVRESRTHDLVQALQVAQEDPVDLRKTSLGIGVTTPANLPAIAHTRPVVPKVEVPRSHDGLTNGVTGGGFDQSGMEALPNNSTAAGTTTGSDKAAEIFAENSK